MPGARWFEGAELNYAQHIFRGKRDTDVAVLHASELRQLGELRWGELREQVASVAAGLRELGVERGDRVVAYLPNIPETLVAFLATASIGAIWSSCSPDFGASSVVDRFAQIEPKVLLCVDGYRYNGKDFDRTETVAGLAARDADDRAHDRRPLPRRRLPTSRPCGAPPPGPSCSPPARARSFGSSRFRSTIRSGSCTRRGPPACRRRSSRATAGILLEHLKKLHLHLDAQDDDRIFWFTTTGWMMWNFLVGVLLTPASIVLYDGSPGHPDMDVLWDLAERTGMTCFGTSASYVAACMKAGVEPSSSRDLERLRAVGSTGSPLSPEGFEWVYEHVGRDTWLFSTSGGTDVCTAFVGGVPLLPVYRGELQGRSLGAAVEAFDEQGNSVVDQVGRARDHRADALDAAVLVGRRGRLALPGELLRAVPGRLAARRLDRDHLARHGGDLRPLRLDHQPPGRADGDQRDLPGGAGGAARCSTRWWSTSRAPGPRAGCRCSSSSSRASDLDERLADRDQAPDPRAMLAPPRPRTPSFRFARCRAR